VRAGAATALCLLLYGASAAQRTHSRCAVVTQSLHSFCIAV
jgi:hypothetical protein